MKNEKTTLNPEIKEQFDKLNFLFEQQLKKGKEDGDFGEDKLAEAIRDSWGDELKTSTCYSMLDHAATLSKTESERARYSLEEAFWIMHDEEAAKLSDLYHFALKITGYWFDEDMSIERKLDLFHTHMKWLMEAAKEVQDEIDTSWQYRSKEYREEIEELKNKLKEAS